MNKMLHTLCKDFSEQIVELQRKCQHSEIVEVEAQGYIFPQRTCKKCGLRESSSDGKWKTLLGEPEILQSRAAATKFLPENVLEMHLRWEQRKKEAG